jgi:hypothetical protein
VIISTSKLFLFSLHPKLCVVLHPEPAETIKQREILEEIA